MILPLTWFTLIVSITVCLAVGVLLVGGVWRKREGRRIVATAPVEPGPAGVNWIGWGLTISAVPLAATLVWTMAVLARAAGPPSQSPLTIDVTGHQWWWQANYPAEGVFGGFSTANEIHVPVGLKVTFRLHGADVIHSFWVPGLSGKTDAIPGQTNLAWLQADRPGVYHGTCAEYCGLEHAKMALDIVADPPAAFARWRANQAQAAAALAPQSAAAGGAALFAAHCGSCHTIRGVVSRSSRGPDLTHLMSRRMVASGMLPNTRGAREGWIQDPQSAKPGALMPGQNLTANQLHDVDAYLETLQ